MDLELCPKCRSWRVTASAKADRTRYDCQECLFGWSVSEQGKLEPLPNENRSRANGRPGGEATAPNVKTLEPVLKFSDPNTQGPVSKDHQLTGTDILAPNLLV